MNDKVMLFYGWDFYPAGVWNDFKGLFTFIDDARTCAESYDKEMDAWAHIVKNGKIVLWGNLSMNYLKNTQDWTWRDEE